MDPLLALRRLPVLGVLALTVGLLQPSPPLTAGEAFRVVFDHQIRYQELNTATPPVWVACSVPSATCLPDTTGYQVRNGTTVLASAPVSANVGGVVTVSVPGGLPAGAHSIIAEALGSTASAAAPVALTVGAFVPSPPQSQGAPSVSRVVIQPSALAIVSATPWASGLAASVTTSAVQVSAGDLLVATGIADASGTTPTTDVTSQPPLAWTHRVGAGTANSATARIWTAPVGVSGSVMVTLQASPSPWRALRVYVVRGADPTVPTGAVWTATSTTNSWTATTYTSTTAGSWGIFVAADYAARGLPTSNDDELGGDAPGLISWLAAAKAGPTPTAGTPVTFHANAPGSLATQWRGAAIEIRPRP